MMVVFCWFAFEFGVVVGYGFECAFEYDIGCKCWFVLGLALNLCVCVCV